MLKKTILLATGAFFLAGTLSCGTLIYPERRGQRKGDIDPAVAILDGVGLLVFIIPGLIAYAIDFSTGAIYLPHGRHHSEMEGDVKVVRAASRAWSDIAAAIEKETGRRPDLADPRLRIYVPDRRDAASGPVLASLAAGGPVAAGWQACSLSKAGVLTTGDGRLVAMLPGPGRAL
ncbi:MAG: hypothetical protein M0017_05340 [Desulfobacteraceae bacterium]|nr:hypothetical protein [Desulfobacteraceae bacterium]